MATTERRARRLEWIVTDEPVDPDVHLQIVRDITIGGRIKIEKLWEVHMAKAGKQRRTDNVLTMPSVGSPTTMAMTSGVTEGDIARRAFELYCDRGREDGHDVRDWLTAEGELREASRSSAA